MPRKPTGQPPLQAMAVKLPAPLIAEIRRYADLHRKTISDVIREGLELRLHGVQPPSHAPGNPPIPASTVATVAQIATTLTTAADQLRNLCQSATAPEAGEPLSTSALSAPTGNTAYNGYTTIEEDAYNGNTSETPAREPTTESAAEEMETDTPAQTPDAHEPRHATKRGKPRVSPTHADVSPPAPATVPDTNIPAFDPSKYCLGKLCPRGHEHGTTGQSLLKMSNRHCPACDREKWHEKGSAQRQAKQKPPQRPRR